MELGRSAPTLLPAPGERSQLRGSPCATPRSATARRWVSAVLSLRHFRLARWCSLSLGAWLPKILARRILTGSGRLGGAAAVHTDRPARAACWPRRRVLFSEVAAFFFAKSSCSFSPMMELGRSAPTLLPAPGERSQLRGRRAQHPDRNGPKMGLRRALSPPFPAGEMVFFIAWRVAAEESGAAHLDRLGPPGWCRGCAPDRPARAACWPRRRVLFSEVAAFFFAKSSCSFSPMMELGRSAPTRPAAATRRHRCRPRMVTADCAWFR